MSSSVLGSLPAGLQPENSSRLAKVMELGMKLVKLDEVIVCFGQLSELFETISPETPADKLGRVEFALEQCAKLSGEIGLRVTGATVEGFLVMVRLGIRDAAAYANAAEQLFDVARRELALDTCLLIPQCHQNYWDNEKPFGAAVWQTFPDARFDLTEACNCFALDRFTASTFHAMRALENGLETLCDHFFVPRVDSNWQRMIQDIEKAVNGMAGAPNRPDDWKEQRDFYSQILSYLLVVKNAWRNPTAHAGSRVTPIQAETILNNVRGVLQDLATRAES